MLIKKYDEYMDEGAGKISGVINFHYYVLYPDVQSETFISNGIIITESCNKITFLRPQ